MSMCFQVVKLSALSFLLSYAGICGASAMGPGGTGGGDEVGLEFASDFNAALSDIRKDASASFVNLSTRNLKAAFSAAHVLVSDGPLTAQLGGVQQDSVAVNIPSRQLIIINRKRWNEIGDSYLKRGIALHEVASLLGLETTGSYPFSSAYVSRHGLNAKALAATAQLDGNTSSPIDEILVANNLWSGAALSETDGKTQVGAMQITLNTVNIIGEAQPALNASISFLGATNGNIADFQSQTGYYNALSGAFQTQFTVDRRIGGQLKTEVVTLTAILNSHKGTMDGTVELAGYRGYGAKFHLVRGGKSLKSIALQNANNPTGAFSQLNYSGIATFHNPMDGVASKPVNMNIFNAPMAVEEDFLTVLSPQRPLIVNLNFGDAAQIAFSNVLWDIRTGRLTGTAALPGRPSGVAAAPQMNLLALECDYNSSKQGFLCNFQTTDRVGTIATADLHSDSSATSDPVGNTATRDAIVYTYRGKMTVNNIDPEHPGVTRPVTYNIDLTTISAARTRLQEVTELFEPVSEKYLQVSFAIIGSGIGDNFATTTWDMINHTLDGNATSTTPGGLPTNSYIKCTNFTFQNPTVVKSYSFTCDWLSSSTGYHIPLVIHN